MKYDDFDKLFHKFISQRDYHVKLEEEQLKIDYEFKRRAIFAKHHEVMNQKIGDNFKLMSLEDKIKFMSSEELTALRIME